MTPVRRTMGDGRTTCTPCRVERTSPAIFSCGPRVVLSAWPRDTRTSPVLKFSPPAMLRDNGAQHSGQPLFRGHLVYTGPAQDVETPVAITAAQS